MRANAKSVSVSLHFEDSLQLAAGSFNRPLVLLSVFVLE
jgi:hypothetical protein